MLWQHRVIEKTTWEREDMMRTRYPFLLRTEVRGLVITVAYACDNFYVCVNFKKNLNLNFLEKWQNGNFLE